VRFFFFVLCKKIGTLAVTLFFASLISFFLLRLIPGDPVLMLLGERGANPEVVTEMRARLGFDKSLPEQYFRFIERALHGDLGTSIVSKASVSEEFFSRFPATVELGICALLLSLIIGIPLGLLAAYKRKSVFDFLSSTIALLGYSMPIFWWGLILILFFSIKHSWTPVSGRIAIEFDIPFKTGFYLIDTWYSSDSWPAFKSAIRHLILPSIALGTIPLAVIVRMTRSSVLEILNEDFIRSARARGFSEMRILFKHALRNALIPILTVVGLMLGSLITGAVLTETIFSWPGVGRWLVKSVEARDYPVIQGGVLYLSFLVVMINFMVDLTYYWINPKLRSH
jgi:dipeptide transport system permease protein